MTAFFRYPHTPHLAWLGESLPREDKVLSESERRELLDYQLVVEEKVDGANIGFSLDDVGELRIQNRGSYLERGSLAPQFRTLFQWADSRSDLLLRHLGPQRILFGEWCFGVHSIRYYELPDWFLAFDVYDRATRRFFDVEARDALARDAGLCLVPRLASGRFTSESLPKLLGKSMLGAARGEGLYLRAVGAPMRRAKLVAPEFTQAMSEHWSRRRLETNSVVKAATI